MKKDKITRNDKNCQTCKIYGKCRWHKWLLDKNECKHKITKLGQIVPNSENKRVGGIEIT